MSSSNIASILRPTPWCFTHMQTESWVILVDRREINTIMGELGNRNNPKVVESAKMAIVNTSASSTINFLQATLTHILLVLISFFLYFLFLSSLTRWQNDRGWKNERKNWGLVCQHSSHEVERWHKLMLCGKEDVSRFSTLLSFLLNTLLSQREKQWHVKPLRHFSLSINILQQFNIL